MKDKRVHATATAWGFAEATLFFIVPDVYLSAVGLYNMRRAIRACLFALLGAMIGGTVMYVWGGSDAEGALRALDKVPSISLEMLAKVRSDLLDIGTWAVPGGPIIGVPYKIFAVQAGAIGIGLAPFLLITIPARLIRFLLLTILLPFVVNRIASRRPLRQRLVVLLAGWAAFYLFYFLKMPN